MYSFGTTLNTTMEQAEKKVREALMNEGFGVLTEIDVKSVMKAKLDIEHIGYKILGACNPHLARQAIATEADIGLLLPCNVLLREAGENQVYVGFMDPQAVLGMVDNPHIGEVAQQVKQKLHNVMAEIQ